MACIFLFLSPRSISIFFKRFTFRFEIFFLINLKVFRLKSRCKFDYLYPCPNPSKPRNSFLKILVLQNSLKSPFLPSQILCNFLGIFPQIFLPPESLYSISNPILIQKSIKIDFLLLFWISARAMVSARPPPFLSSPAVAHLLPPFPA
jgi:hypothetical protein